MKGNQTPQKELPRSAESALRRVKEAPSKSPSDQLKKPLKISKKCLDSSFAAIPEDQSPGKSVSSSINSDPNSVLVNSSVDQNKQLSEVFKLSMNPEFPVSPVTFDPFEVSPSSTIVEENQEIDSGTIVDYNGTVDCNTPKTGSIDVGIAVDFIREALFQASSSPIVDLRSKKILDSVVKIVIDDMYGFPEEKVPSPDVMSNKLRTGFLYFLLWLVPVSVVAVALSNLFAGSSFPDPPPT